MLIVKTVLKHGQGFIPIEQWQGKLTDADYVAGALIVTLDGTVILDESLWDDINWLWPLIVNGLPDLLDGKDVMTRFPDQPISFSVTHVDREWLRLQVCCGEHDYARKKLRKRDYLREMTRAGIDFFTRFDAIAPRDYSAAHYLPILRHIAATIERGCEC